MTPDGDRHDEAKRTPRYRRTNASNKEKSRSVTLGLKCGITEECLPSRPIILNHKEALEGHAVSTLLGQRDDLYLEVLRLAGRAGPP